MQSETKITIRPIQKSDDEAIGDIVKAVFEEFDAPKVGTVYSDPRTFRLFEEMEAVEKAGYFVAEENGKILGGCGFFPTEGLPEGCAEIVKFYLLPEARGKHLGSKLLEIAEKAAKEAGYTTAYIESLLHFARAVSMYRKSGYVDSERLGNSGHSATTVMMLKTL